MPAPGATPIILYNSATAAAVPSAANLSPGELAVNVTDKKIYSKNSGGSVITLVGSLGGQDANAVAITGGAINGTAIGGTTPAAGAFTTLSATTPLAASSGGTGLSALGAGVATFLGTPSSANLLAAVTDETGTGLVVFNVSPAITTPVLTGTRETRVAGGTGGAYAVDLATGNYFTRTFNAAAAITVSNVPAAGTAVNFIFDITNAGAFTITWMTGIKWAGGTAPTLTAAGRDVLGFFTTDGGTTWNGFVLGLDVK